MDIREAIYENKTLVFINVIALFLCLLIVAIDYGCVSRSVVTCLVAKVFFPLLLSFIAASIFYLMVNYREYKRRQNVIKPIIRNNIKKLVELLRQIKEIPIAFMLEQDCSREEYIRRFSQFDFNSAHPFKANATIEDDLNVLREKLNLVIRNILIYHEFMQEKQLDCVIDISNSLFLNELMVFNYEKCPEEYKNQDQMGACIYDLYNNREILLQ